MSGQNGRLRRAMLILVGGGVSLSLLFWAKLRLVTQIPRTTYAVPEQRGGDVEPDGGSKRPGEEPERPEESPRR